jgi:flagellar export protein FliJ
MRGLASRLSAISASINEIGGAIDDHMEALKHAGLSGPDFCTAAGYVRCMEIRKAALIEERVNCEQAITLLRQELVEKAREIKILGKLLKKKLLQKRMEENRALQKKLDDIAIRNTRSKSFLP